MKLSGDRCQCTVCDEYFNSTTAFEKHRKGQYGKDRHCKYPSDVGMVKNKAGFWITSAREWGQEKSPEIDA